MGFPPAKSISSIFSLSTFPPFSSCSVVMICRDGAARCGRRRSALERNTPHESVLVVDVEHEDAHTAVARVAAAANAWKRGVQIPLHLLSASWRDRECQEEQDDDSDRDHATTHHDPPPKTV